MNKSGMYENPGSRDDVANILRDLRKLTSNEEATIEDLLTPEFLQANTDFADFDEFISSLGTDDTDDMLEDVLNAGVVEHSHFDSYPAMLQAAFEAREKEMQGDKHGGREAAHGDRRPNTAQEAL